MNNELRTDEAKELLWKIKPLVRTALIAINDQRISDGRAILEDIRAAELERVGIQVDCDDFRNDLWVIDRYIDFFDKYGQFWSSVLCQSFSESWCLLQDALDLLRLLKKFSHINVEFFEDQLIELEGAYPYKLFFSVGLTVDFFECSICGQDIDSQQCLHIRGDLYGGVMAHAIARNVIKLDHVSLVKHPEDKRCVVSYEDSGKGFNVIRSVSSLVLSKRCRISDFNRLEYSKRLHPNPDYRKLPRNDRCFCGSGIKFKHCCIGKESVEDDHVEIIIEPRLIERGII